MAWTVEQKEKLFKSVSDRLTPIASDLQAFSEDFDAEDVEGKMAGKAAGELVNFIGRFAVLSNKYSQKKSGE